MSVRQADKTARKRTTTPVQNSKQYFKIKTLFLSHGRRSCQSCLPHWNIYCILYGIEAKRMSNTMRSRMRDRTARMEWWRSGSDRLRLKFESASRARSWHGSCGRPRRWWGCYHALDCTCSEVRLSQLLLGTRISLRTQSRKIW